MSRHRSLFLLVMLGVAAMPGVAAARQAMPGEIVVQFDATAPAAAHEPARQAARVSVVRAMRRPGQQLVKVRDGQSVARAIRRLESDPHVRYAEPNYVYTAGGVPNDALFNQLWGLRNAGQSIRGFPGSFGVDIDAARAWDFLTGSSGVIVAVVDSGIAYDHPDLDDNLWSNPGEIVNGLDDDANGHADDVRGFDFVDNDADPRDTAGHGTHVAGTIGAEGNNGAGVTGVAWDVQLMAVRAANAGNTGTSAAIADGLDYAGDEGARVATAALVSGQPSLALSDAITSHPNTLYVTAAGNDGANNENTPVFPCNLPAANLICVNATTRADGLAPFSNTGNVSVDLAAPGTDILSAQPSYGAEEGFEVDDIATEWVTAGAPQWERTSTAANLGSFSVTDSPGGNYPPSARSSIHTAQPVPLNGASCRIEAQLQMDAFAGDILWLDTSLDGQAWTELGGATFDTNGAWVPIFAPLQPSANPLYIRFRFAADASNEGDGVYLDDIRLGCVDTTYEGSEYAFSSGTSMAAAHVAGAAALLFSARPGASVASVKADLLSTGDPVPALLNLTATARRLDVRAALLRDLVQTGAATEVSATGARLNGTIQPPGPPTSYQFEYGTTTAYGSVAPGAPAPAGGGAVSEAIAGLAPGTTYHFRLVAIVNGQRVGGSDGVFTTTSVAAGPPPKTLRDVAVRRCRQSGRGRRTRLRCTLANQDALASARLQLKRGRRTIGRGSVKPSRSGTLTMRLKRKLGRGRYVLTLRLRDATGNTRTMRFRFRIR